MKNYSETTKSTIDGIQYLRAVAALMVVIFHSKLTVSGSEAWPVFGHTGVDIFFVISGFVMAYTTQNLNPNVNIKYRIADTYEFLRKRLIRIYPLYFIGLLWVSRRDLWQGDVSADLFKDLLFIPHPNFEYPGMLAPTLIQGWTLNYEMFFYLIFGISLLAGKFRTLITVASLLILVTIGFIFKSANSAFNPNSFADMAYHFYTNSMLLEFGLGILAYQVFIKIQHVEIPRIALLIVAICAFIALALLSEQTTGLRGVVLGIPAFLIVVSVSKLCLGVKIPFLNLLGDASYAIYLFHWASFGATKPLVNYLAPSAQEPSTVAILIIANFVVAIISGIAIHLLIEKPLLRNIKHIGKRTFKPKAALSLS